MSGLPARSPQEPAVPPAEGAGAERLAADGQSAPRELRAVVERRGPQRLQPDGLLPLAASTTANVAGDPAADLRFYLPPQANGMAISLMVAFGLSIAVAGRFPSLSAALAAVLATGLLAACNLFAAVERRSGTTPAMRIALLVCATVLPMACAGFTLGSGISNGLPWP